MGDAFLEQLTEVLTRMAAEQGTGALRATDPRGRVATVWIRDGRVVDCDAEGRVGEAGFHRLLRWEEGRVLATPGARARNERIRRTTRELFLESARRREAWDRLVAPLPLERALQIDYLVLSDRLGDVPDELNAILRLVDGRRTVREVLEQAPGDELDAATAVARLLAEGLLRSPAAANLPPGPPGARGVGADVAALPAPASHDSSLSPPRGERAGERGPEALAPSLHPRPAGVEPDAAPAGPSERPAWPRIVRFPAHERPPRPPLEIEVPGPPPSVRVTEPPVATSAGPPGEVEPPDGTAIPDRPQAAPSAALENRAFEPSLPSRPVRRRRLGSGGLVLLALLALALAAWGLLGAAG